MKEDNDRTSAYRAPLVKEWKKEAAFAAAFILAAFITVCLVGILSVIIDPDWLTFGSLFVAIIFWLVGTGLIEIPIQHMAVPLFLGKRMRHWILREGVNWILPPLMSAEIVDGRERLTRVGEADRKGQNQLVTITIGGKENERKRLVQMLTGITIRWQVVDPYEFISVGEKTVEQGLVDVTIKTFRQRSAQVSDLELIQNTNEFEKELLHAIEEEGGEVTEGKRRDDRDKVIARWGIKVLSVFIPHVSHKDEEVIRAYEKLTKEEQERGAETIEREFLVESIERLTAAGLSPQEAVLALQAERKKIKRAEIIVTTSKGDGDSGSADLTKAAAIIAAKNLIDDTGENRKE